MARLDDLIEANKRGLLSGQVKTDYDEAVSRGLVPSQEPAAATFGQAVAQEPPSVSGLRLEQSTLGGTERQPVGTELISGIGTRLEQRAETIGQIADTGAESLPATLQPVGKTALIVGQVAGGVVDVVSETIFSAAKTLTPEPVKAAVKNRLTQFAQTEIGKAGIEAVRKGSEAYGQFKKERPDAALALEGIMNIADVTIGGVLGGRAKDIKKIVPKAKGVTARQIDKRIFTNVKENLIKAAKPSVAGQKTASQTKKYFNKASEAVNTIIENRNSLNLTDDAGNIVTGTLPRNLKQFTEAIDNTKKSLFTQYDEIAQQAGQAGATIDTAKVASKLDDIINDKGLQAVSPEIVSYALDKKIGLVEIGKLTAKDTQTAIQALNAKLSSLKDFDSTARAYVDQLIVNNMRQSLDDVIKQTTGKEYQILKRKYGALKTIEKDVNRRAMVDARKNAKGLIDFTDVFTGSEVITGILTANSAKVAKGVFGKAIAAFIKAKNNPNRNVKNMFKDVDKLLKRKALTKQ